MYIIFLVLKPMSLICTMKMKNFHVWINFLSFIIILTCSCKLNFILLFGQLGIIIRAATIGHIPPTNFILVTMGSTSVLLIGWRALLFSFLTNDKSKKNDVYKSGSPFELFEVMNLLLFFPLLFDF